MSNTLYGIPGTAYLISEIYKLELSIVSPEFEIESIEYLHKTDALREGEHNRGTGCGKTALPGLGGGQGNRHSYRERQLDESCSRLDNVPHLSYIYKNSNGGKPWAKHPQSEPELNPI